MMFSAATSSSTRLAEWNPKGLTAGAVPLGLGDQLCATKEVKYQLYAGLCCTSLPLFFSTHGHPARLSAQLNYAPAYLKGDLPGDVGFDPMCLAATYVDLKGKSPAERLQLFTSLPDEEQQNALGWMREAELKHARLAMLAAAGWPLSELFAKSLLIDTNGRAPSLFNGEMLELPFGPFVLAFFAGFAYLELETKDTVKGGDYGFDPFGFATGNVKLPGDILPNVPFSSLPNVGDMRKLQVAEIKNGRAAMMAITGFSVQEFLWGKPVVELTPWFF